MQPDWPTTTLTRVQSLPPAAAAPGLRLNCPEVTECVGRVWLTGSPGHLCRGSVMSQLTIRDLHMEGGASSAAVNRKFICVLSVRVSQLIS